MCNMSITFMCLPPCIFCNVSWVMHYIHTINYFRPEGIFEKYQVSWGFKMAFGIIKVKVQF